VGGVFVLRIEDTDLKRSQQDYEQSIIRDLHWLGLQADEGPDLGGGHGPYRQSERGELYEAGAQKLLQSGHAYRCFCTQERLDRLKEEQLSRGEMPKYDRRCLGLSQDAVRERLSAGEEATVRFLVPPGEVSFVDLIHGPINFSSEVIGDFIIKRTDGGFAYNYAVVIDDAGMQITHVIRGEDHLTNTARQLMLYRALEQRAPEYAHHSLILGTDGGKLSKRHGATSIGEFRDMGYLAGAVVNYLALLSWHPPDEREKLTLDEIGGEFDLGRVSKSPAVFDIDKLNWLNGLYLRELSPDELAAEVGPYLARAQVLLAPEQLPVVVSAIQSNLVTLADGPEHARLFTEDFVPADSAHAEVLAHEGVDVVLELLGGILEGTTAEYFDLEQARGMLRYLTEACKERGIKGKALYQPLRVALTGRDQGPEIFYLVAGLGRTQLLARLAAAREYVAGLGLGHRHPSDAADHSDAHVAPSVTDSGGPAPGAIDRREG